MPAAAASLLGRRVRVAAAAALSAVLAASALLGTPAAADAAADPVRCASYDVSLLRLTESELVV